MAVSLAAVLLSGARADEALDALIDEAFGECYVCGRLE